MHFNEVFTLFVPEIDPYTRLAIYKNRGSFKAYAELTDGGNETHEKDKGLICTTFEEARVINLENLKEGAYLIKGQFEREDIPEAPLGELGKVVERYLITSTTHYKGKRLEYLEIEVR